MKVSLKWVSEYTQIKLPQEELVSKIKSQLGEVEQIIDHEKKYEDIVLAEVIEKSDHPEADKLGVYQVSIGKGEPIQVVAGDKKIEVGNKVAYLKPGAKVPYNPHPEKYDGIIRSVKLRGIDSNGMLGSGRELDINNDHESVMILDVEDISGTPIAKVLHMDDTVLEIENKALTNRADCFGLIGLAREIAGIQGIQFNSPDWFRQHEHSIKGSSDELLPIVITNEAFNLCPRYSASTIMNVTIKPSPIWLQSVLIRSGVRPINNIVDVTNYIMLLTGQPLHAFDYDKLRRKDPNGENTAHITIRLAKNNEKLNALNETVYELEDSNLVICDSTNPIALAGMIGGADTEIDENTQNVVLESANFDMYNNRKSSMLLGIFTEAVTRYSKGQDPALTVPAMKHASQLIEELSDGVVVGEFDVKDKNDFGKDRYISVNVDKMNTHLGTSLSKKEVVTILQNVELISKIEGDHITVEVPSYRNDLRMAVDIHEEVARLYGYDNIEISIPHKKLTPVKHNPLLDLKEEIRKFLAAANTNEVLSYNFVGKELLEDCDLPLKDCYRIINAPSPDLEYMRPSLVPSLLDITRKNLSINRYKTVLYEINKSHRQSEINEEGLPKELEELAFILTNDHNSKQEVTDYSGSALYTLKKYTNELLSNLNIKNWSYLSPDKLNNNTIPSWIQTSLKMYDTNAVAVIVVPLDTGNDHLGVVGEFSPKIKMNFKLPDHSGGFQLNLKTVLRNKSETSQYIEPSKFPTVSYDICFKVDRDVPYGVIEELLKRSFKKTGLIFNVTPVDIYMSPELEKNDKRHITLRLALSDKEKTLEISEIEKIAKKAARYIRRETNAVVV